MKKLFSWTYGKTLVSEKFTSENMVTQYENTEDALSSGAWVAYVNM